MSVYGTSPLNGKRHRRTKAELAEIDDAIYEIAEAEEPVTVRGLFYRVMSRGLVPKTEQGYSVVQRQALKMRRNGELPYGWITDGSRLRLKPRSFTSAQAALENTAQMYRRDLWIDQEMHVEVWCEKDAIRGVVVPVTAQYDVPLMISRGYSSETFLWSKPARDRVPRIRPRALGGRDQGEGPTRDQGHDAHRVAPDLQLLGVHRGPLPRQRRRDNGPDRADVLSRKGLNLRPLRPELCVLGVWRC
jgi:hypothetical protein